MSGRRDAAEWRTRLLRMEECMDQARQEGKLTKASLEKAISSRLGKETETNVSNYFTLHQIGRAHV